MQITHATKTYIGKRGWATFIDYTFIFFVYGSYIFLVGEPNDSGGRTVNGLPALIPCLVWFLYFVVIEYSQGGTPGHLLMGLRVRSLSNEPVTFWRTVKRRLADAVEISWCLGFVAWLIARSTPNNQRLGDILAQTCVLGENEHPTDFTFDFDKPVEAV